MIPVLSLANNYFTKYFDYVTFRLSYLNPIDRSER